MGGENSQLSGTEVLGETIGSFLRASEVFTGDPEALFSPGLEHLLHRPKRYAWADFCEIYRRVDEAARTSGSTVEAYGEEVVRSPQMGATFRYVGLVASPKLLYSLGNRMGIARCFNNLQLTETEDSQGRLDIRIVVPDRYPSCEPFFRLTRGILKGLPSLIGLPDAEVTLELDDRSARYLVRLPPSATVWARLRRSFSAFFLGRSALKELARQQEQLNDQYLQLQAAHEHLAAALQTKKRFLSVVNHELRTPLNGIKGTLLALGQAEDKDARASLVQTLTECADDISRLIGGILEYNGVEEEHATPFVIEVGTTELLGELEDWARARAEAKGINIDFLGSSDLPAHIEIDARRLRQAAWQLVDNAIKFTDQGYVKVELRFEGDELVLQVRDTGPGIRTEDQERVFELFTQGSDGSTRGYGGAGLGLALAKRLATFLGGSITMNSYVGEGTTVTVRVPSKAVEQSPPLMDSQDLPSRVLVVDDNRVNRRVLGRMLERLHWVVDEAENGREAVTRAENIAYAAIFMDCEMPIMDGFEAARRIRSATGDDMPIIAVTAYVTEKDRQRCFNAGMNDFLAKPLSPANIAESLVRWVGRSEPSSDVPRSISEERRIAAGFSSGR